MKNQVDELVAESNNKGGGKKEKRGDDRNSSRGRGRGSRGRGGSQQNARDGAKLCKYNIGSMKNDILGKGF